MIQKLYTVSAAGTDPRANLAAESALLDHALKDAMILYLWQNDNTVVIGRNQNVYRECNLKNMEQDQVILVRRPSGGGAVYHDLGNLNYTFITDDENYSIRKQSEVIVKALSYHGLSAEISGRNDLLIDGHKFSGNAYYHHHGFSYHHGTLLIHSDLNKMPLYLNPDPLKLKANSVASVKSRVSNLNAYDPSLTVEKMQQLLIKAAEEIYGVKAESIRLPEDESFEYYYQLYSSKEWIYGKNPPFDISFAERFGWGGIELRFKVRKGIIEDCMITSDSMEPDTIDAIAEQLKGCVCHSTDMIQKLKTLDNSMITADLCEWIGRQEI